MYNCCDDTRERLKGACWGSAGRVLYRRSAVTVAIVPTVTIAVAPSFLPLARREEL
jgi:hypothetical protein